METDMSKFNLLGRFSALESDVPESSVSAAEDIPQDVLETAVDTEVDGSDTVEGHAVEAEEAEADVVEADAAAEDLQETSEALESYLEIVQDARMSRRGLTKGEAHILYVGINNAVKKVGMDVGDIAGNVSVESFDGGRDSLGRCASLENAIVDAIKKFWEAIKNQISKMVKYVRDWWLKHLDGAARLKKKAEKLKEKASNTTGTAKEKKVKLSVHRQLSKGKSVSDIGFIKSGLDITTQLIDLTTTSRIADSFSENLDEIEKTVNEIYDSETPVTAAAVNIDFSKLTTSMKGIMSSDAKYNKVVGVDGNEFVATVTDELPGYKIFAMAKANSNFLSKFTGESDPVKKSELFKRSVEVQKPNIRYAVDKIPEIDSSAEYKTLTPSECSELCDGVIKICESIMAYKQNFDRYESATKKFLNKMDGIYKKTIKGDEKSAMINPKVGKNLGGAAASYIRGRTTAITSLIGYGNGLGRASCAYVQSSLSQYKD